MKGFTIAVIAAAFISLVLSFVMAASATANSGTCYNIADADRRALCLAKAHENPGLCYNIRDVAIRSECLAEVKR